MTRVDFYVLPQNDPLQRLKFACRLTEKAWSLGHQIHIHTTSEQETELLDKLLWTFKQSSFIPHGIHSVDTLTAQPITLSHNASPDTQEVLINLAAEVPLFFSQFDRVAELVNQDDTIKQQGRQRYSFYQQRGYALETHTLSK
ncbi:MAG: DNA polymerase III subunit chi [Gammaproteobacteria bacterium]